MCQPNIKTVSGYLSEYLVVLGPSYATIYKMPEYKTVHRWERNEGFTSRTHLHSMDILDEALALLGKEVYG